MIVDEDARKTRRTELKRDYEAIKSLAKAPSWRRGIAAMVDLFVAFSPYAISWPEPLTWVPHALCGILILLKDSLLGSVGLGKSLVGLRVYDYARLEPVTMWRKVARNGVYAVVFVPLAIGMAFFSAAAMVILPLSVFGIMALFSQCNALAIIGYNPDDGRTIPDDWLNTHVLTPSEVRIIRDYQQKIRELGAKLP